MKAATIACVLVSYCALLGRSDAARATLGREDSAARELLATSPSPSIRNCGGHSYDAADSICVTVGEQQWLCPTTASCACPTDRLGLRPYDCYDPSQYYCSSRSTEWPRSGLLPVNTGVGLSDAGTCSIQAPGPAPALAPAAGFGV